MSDHLLDHVRPVLDRSMEERIAYIQAPRWIGHHVAVQAHERLSELLARPPALRTRGLMLIGPYANGKTMIAERFAVGHLRTAEQQRVWVVQTREGGLHQLHGSGFGLRIVTRNWNGDTSRLPFQLASFGECHRQRGVPCFDDGTTDLLVRPNTFELAAIDLCNRTVTERIVIGGVDHDDVGRHVVKGPGEIGILAERDCKNYRLNALHGLLLRESGSPDRARKIADSLRPLRIGDVDLMTTGDKLLRQRGADISGADDLHEMSFRECVAGSLAKSGFTFRMCSRPLATSSKQDALGFGFRPVARAAFADSGRMQMRARNGAGN